MRVEIKVAQLDSRKAARLRELFDLASTGELFKRVKLNDLMDSIVQQAIERSPRRFDELGDVTSAFTEGSFAAGWRLRRESKGNRLLFVLSNVLDSRGGRSEAKFKSIELGSRAQILKPAKKTYVFFGRTGWVTVAEGRGPYTNSKGESMPGIKRPARRGAHVTESVRSFVVRKILPEVDHRVHVRVQQLLERL